MAIDYIGYKNIIQVPQGITLSGEALFYEDKVLEEVCLPLELKYINDSAFEDYPNVNIIK